MSRTSDALRRGIATGCVILVISGLLLVVVNLVAHWWLETGPWRPDRAGLFLDPGSPEAIALRVRALAAGGPSDFQGGRAPNIRPHPVLHFTEGRARPGYTVGVEGVRYEPGWTDEHVRARLRNRASVFVFGGSTTFGDRVGDAQTLPVALAAADASRPYLNFGIQSYDSLREVDLLLHLLRKGYRPGAVLFVDGLNDVTTFARSPYPPHESPRTHGLVLDRGEVPLVFGYPTPENLRSALSYANPVVHALRHLAAGAAFGEGPARPLRADRDDMDWQVIMRHHYEWSARHARRAAELGSEIEAYYAENIRFVRELARSFGFSSHFVLQPVGLLDPENPFLRAKFFGSPEHRVFEGVYAVLTDAISESRLDMIDCSGALAGVPADVRWVDATHYGPVASTALAACIGRVPDASGP
jgi:hypothetical protein